jgi:hypothetical protein
MGESFDRGLRGFKRIQGVLTTEHTEIITNDEARRTKHEGMTIEIQKNKLEVPSHDKHCDRGSEHCPHHNADYNARED